MDNYTKQRQIAQETLYMVNSVLEKLNNEEPLYYQNGRRRRSRYGRYIRNDYDYRYDACYDDMFYDDVNYRRYVDRYDCMDDERFRIYRERQAFQLKIYKQTCCKCGINYIESEKELQPGYICDTCKNNEGKFVFHEHGMRYEKYADKQDEISNEPKLTDEQQEQVDEKGYTILDELEYDPYKLTLFEKFIKFIFRL